MYILRIDGYPHTYDPGDRTRTPFTLVAAMRAAYGCGNAHVERADGTRVVTDAGRAFSDLVHAPTGRRFRRISGYGARPDQGHPFTLVHSNWTPPVTGLIPALPVWRVLDRAFKCTECGTLQRDGGWGTSDLRHELCDECNTVRIEAEWRARAEAR